MREEMDGDKKTAIGQPLSGLCVLELASMYAGPFAGKILSDFGATVLHVEDPQKGDPARGWQPKKNGISLGFARMNANKRLVTADLRTDSGRDLARRMAAECDVVISNFRPSTLAHWDLDFSSLSAKYPRLVMAVVSGFGSDEENSDKPGFGTVADGVSGFAYSNGWPATPPTVAPFGLADSIAGLAAAFGVLVGLRERDFTGRGSEVDVALYEPLLNIMGGEILQFSALGLARGRAGNSSDTASPRGVYETSDGQWVVISASSEGTAKRLFSAMRDDALRDDLRFRTNERRVEHNAELNELVSRWVATQTRREILDELAEYGVPAGPVNSPEDIVHNEEFVRRGSTTVLSGRELDEVVVPGRIFRYGGLPPVRYSQPSGIGGDTEAVLRSLLGMSASEVATLRRAGAI